MLCMKLSEQGIIREGGLACKLAGCHFERLGQKKQPSISLFQNQNSVIKFGGPKRRSSKWQRRLNVLEARDEFLMAAISLLR
jgi:hypothetical protein